MKVSDWMWKDTHTVRVNESLDEAAGIMLRHDCGSVPVVDEQEEVIGMITDRDICMCGLIEGKPLNRLPVSLAMTKELWSCKAEDTVHDAEELMRTHKLHRLPVLGNKGELVGVFRVNDLLRATKNRKGPNATEVVETLRAITDRRPEPIHEKELAGTTKTV